MLFLKLIVVLYITFSLNGAVKDLNESAIYGWVMALILFIGTLQ